LSHYFIRIDKSRVRLWSFRLLTIFLASENLHGLCNGEYDFGADILANEYEKAEIEHLMLQIATLFRSADTCAIEKRTIDTRWNPTVGELEQPIGSPSSELSLREACNKIIHVREIEYELVDGDYDWNRFLKPIVYLYGEKHGKQWKAILDIKKFCFEVCHIPQ